MPSQVQSIADRSSKIYSWTILLVPANWLLGTTLPWTLGASALTWLRLRRMSSGEVALALLAAALLGSAAIHTAQAGPSQRIIAAGFNIAVLLTAIAALWAGRQIGKTLYSSRTTFDRIPTSAWTLWRISAFYLLLVIVYSRVVAPPIGTYPTLILGLAPDPPGILAFYSQFKVANTDWTTWGESTRPLGFGIYSTEGAQLFSLAAILALLRTQRSRAVQIVVEVTTIVVLVAMASRTILLGYCLGLLIATALGSRAVTANILMVAAFGGALLSVGVLMGGDETVASLVGGLFEARAGSTDTRFQSYSLAIQLVVEQNLVFGLGVKPLDDSTLGIPIGSHSALISTFTKGGIVSLVLFVFFYFSILISWTVFIVRFGDRLARADLATWKRTLLLYRAAFVTMLWMLTEDIDAAINGTVLAFLGIGLGLGAMNAVRRELARTAQCARPITVGDLRIAC